MTRRNKRTSKPAELSDDAKVMLSRCSELTRVPALFRRAGRQSEEVLDELRDARVFTTHRRDSSAIGLSEKGLEMARSIRSARLSKDPQDDELEGIGT